MIEQYPEIALERFDKANLWIKYVIFKIRRFLKDVYRVIHLQKIKWAQHWEIFLVRRRDQ